PRPNEGGGKYGLGVITATYKQGAELELGVELTANHNGFFEFRLCPHNNPTKPVTNQCLDEHVLQKLDQTGQRYYPPAGSRKLYMR
ncbi:Cellulose/chitin-binding protein N-terminal, partial [Trinorchestia longiramus]